MVHKRKPTKDLVIKVESIKTRLERIKLSNEFKIIGMLNNQMLQIMNLFDWSDQEYIVNGKSGLTDCFGEVMIPADYDETCFRADYFVPRDTMKPASGLTILFQGKSQLPVKKEINGEWFCLMERGVLLPTFFMTI